MLAARIERYLLELQQKNLFRERIAWSARQGKEIFLRERAYCSFVSNDYLGLSQHPKMVEMIQSYTQQFGHGASASALVAGYSSVHREFEERMAAWLGYPRALLCNSGFMANIACLQSLGQLQVKFIIDAENHASLNDGVRLTKAPFKRFNLSRRLQFEENLAAFATDGLVVTDGVFSMSGRISDLKYIRTQCQKHKSWLMVDDAHGIGVIGEAGKGSLSYHQLQPQNIDVLSIPLGKAFAGLGGVILAQEQTIEYILQSARGYIYTTSLPPNLVSGLIAALTIIQQESWRQQQLQDLIQYFRQQAQEHALPFLASQTAIQAILIPDPIKLMAVAEQLRAKGFLVSPIRPPTVSVGSSRLRIVLNALHCRDDIKKLLMCIAVMLGK